MKPIGYLLLRVYEIFFRLRRRIAYAFATILIPIGIGLSILAINVFGAMLFLVIAACIACACISLPVVWAFEKLFPNSPLCQHKEMPANFRKELIEAISSD